MISAVALGVVLSATLVVCCPPAKDLGPNCSCIQLAGEFMMSCKGINRPEDLVAPMRSVSMQGTKIFSLEIRDSSLQYIPHGVFEGTSIEKVHFVNSKIMSLSDTDVAFSGLEDILTEIRATEAKYIASWDWQQLRNLQKLDVIDINQIVIGAVDKPFPRLPRLTALGLTNAGLTHLADGAFTELSGLQILTLKNNKIAELKRSMLPYPADRLKILDLSYNKISSLPEDILYGMPTIKVVHLDGNEFVTLTQDTFSHFFATLSEFSMTENPIRCDCRLQWLADKKIPSHFLAYCAAPESLKDRRIAKLDVKHLQC